MPEIVAVSPTQNLISALWLRNQPQTLDRLALLDRAAAAASSDALTPVLRAEAIAVAHKFAGSLGMFGFHDGTRLARELELQLESPAFEPDLIAGLTGQLRAILIPRL